MLNLERPVYYEGREVKVISIGTDCISEVRVRDIDPNGSTYLTSVDYLTNKCPAHLNAENALRNIFNDAICKLENLSIR